MKSKGNNEDLEREEELDDEDGEECGIECEDCPNRELCENTYLVFTDDFIEKLTCSELDKEHSLSSWLDSMTDIELYFLSEIAREMFEEGESPYAMDILHLAGIMVREAKNLDEDDFEISGEELEESVDKLLFMVMLETMKRSDKVEYEPFSILDDGVEYRMLNEEFNEETLSGPIAEYFEKFGRKDNGACKEG